jgi:hypothetical protein
VFQIKAAVILNPPKEWTLSKNVHVRPVAAYEVDVESDTPAKDQIVTRIGLSSVIVRNDSTAPFSSHIIDWTFDYSTNRGYKATVLGTTVQYTPNYRQIGIGQYFGHGATVDFRWRPYVGVVWSDVNHADDVAAYQKLKSFTHGFVHFAGEIRLTGYGKITPEFKLWHGDRTAADGTFTHWQTQRSVEGRPSRPAHRICVSHRYPPGSRSLPKKRCATESPEPIQLVPYPLKECVDRFLKRLTMCDRRCCFLDRSWLRATSMA